MLLMPDDFKAYSKIKVDNQSFNKFVFSFFYAAYPNEKATEHRRRNIDGKEGVF